MPEAQVDYETQLRRDAKLAEIMFGVFVKCPTTGRFLAGSLGDDKVLCNCGTSNPKVWQERTHLTGVHIVRYCEPATAEQFARQELDRKLSRR